MHDLKRYEEAEKEYQEAIRINPELAEAHGNLGLLLSETGKIKEAKQEVKIALKLFKKQGKKADAKKSEKLLNQLDKK